MPVIHISIAGHLGDSSSGAEIVATRYFHKMKIDPKDPAIEDGSESSAAPES